MRLGRSLSFLRLGGVCTMRRLRHIPSPFRPWRPGVIAQSVHHQQAGIWNNLPTRRCTLCR
jgi:hypothetical protein